MNDFHSKRTKRRKNIPILHNHFGNEEKIILVGLRFIDRRGEQADANEDGGLRGGAPLF